MPINNVTVMLTATAVTGTGMLTCTGFFFVYLYRIEIKLTPFSDIEVKLTIVHLQFVVSVIKVMSVSVEAIIPLNILTTQSINLSGRHAHCIVANFLEYKTGKSYTHKLN